MYKGKVAFICVCFILTFIFFIPLHSVSVASTQLIITNVSITDITTSSAIISWDTNIFSDSVVIYSEKHIRLAEAGEIKKEGDVSYVVKHNITLTGLNPSTTYYYVVNSESKDGTSNKSMVYNFTTNSPIKDTSPPASITNLHQLNNGTDFIEWDWTNPPDEDFSHVEVWLNGDPKGNVFAPNHSYNATELEANTWYEIKLRPVDRNNNVNESCIPGTATTLPHGQPLDNKVLVIAALMCSIVIVLVVLKDKIKTVLENIKTFFHRKETKTAPSEQIEPYESKENKLNAFIPNLKGCSDIIETLIDLRSNGYSQTAVSAKLRQGGYKLEEYLQTLKELERLTLPNQLNQGIGELEKKRIELELNVAELSGKQKELDKIEKRISKKKSILDEIERGKDTLKDIEKEIKDGKVILENKNTAIRKATEELGEKNKEINKREKYFGLLGENIENLEGNQKQKMEEIRLIDEYSGKFESLINDLSKQSAEKGDTAYIIDQSFYNNLTSFNNGDNILIPVGDGVECVFSFGNKLLESDTCKLIEAAPEIENEYKKACNKINTAYTREMINKKLMMSAFWEACVNNTRDGISKSKAAGDSYDDNRLIGALATLYEVGGNMIGTGYGGELKRIHKDDEDVKKLVIRSIVDTIKMNKNNRNWLDIAYNRTKEELEETKVISWVKDLFVNPLLFRIEKMEKEKEEKLVFVMIGWSFAKYLEKFGGLYD